MLHAIVHPADIQDRDGGILLLATLFGMYPFLQKLFADGVQGPGIPEGLGNHHPTSKLKSSSAPITRKDLWYCRAAGSWKRQSPPPIQVTSLAPLFGMDRNRMCKIADNSDPLRGIFAFNSDPF